jgi:integrase
VAWFCSELSRWLYWGIASCPAFDVANLPKQRFHDLRHARISLLGAQGVPLKVIAEIVGHSDIRLTQNVYQHVYSEAKRAAAGTMDTLLSRLENGPEKPVATTVATKPV